MFFYFKMLFSKFWTNLCILLYCNNWSKIIVCDIDNTIADTWKNIENEKIPYSKLPYFDNVLKFIFSKKDNKTGIIFLSFRPQKKFIISSRSSARFYACNKPGIISYSISGTGA